MNPLLVGPLLELVTRGLDKIFPDPEQKAQAQLELLKMEQEGAFKHLEAELQRNLAQAAINKEEAASPSLYKSGWRPAFGWVGVFALISEFILRPYLPWAMEVFGFQVPPLPSIDTEMFWLLVFGLLGISGMRTFEKKVRVTS